MSLNKFQQQLLKVPTENRKFVLDNLTAYCITRKKERETSDYPDAMLVAIDKTDMAMDKFVQSAICVLDKKMSSAGTKWMMKRNQEAMSKSASSARGKYYKNIATLYESELTQPQRNAFIQGVLSQEAQPSVPLLMMNKAQKDK